MQYSNPVIVKTMAPEISKSIQPKFFLPFKGTQPTITEFEPFVRKLNKKLALVGKQNLPRSMPGSNNTFSAAFVTALVPFRQEPHVLETLRIPSVL